MPSYPSCTDDKLTARASSDHRAALQAPLPTPQAQVFQASPRLQPNCSPFLRAMTPPNQQPTSSAALPALQTSKATSFPKPAAPCLIPGPPAAPSPPACARSQHHPPKAIAPSLRGRFSRQNKDGNYSGSM